MVKISKSLESMLVSVFLFVNFGKWRMKDMFDTWYTGHDKSLTIREIFRDAFASDYLAEVDQSSFVTQTDLYCMLKYLNIAKDDNFVDIGCGQGGPGLWIARENSANLIGIDISEVALSAARHRISDFNLKQDVRFQIGSFEDTGLPEASCDGAISIDALFLASDKKKAIEEVYRVLRPSGRLVFTSWEGDMTGLVKDHRQLLENNGFKVDFCEEPEGWKKRQAAVYRHIMDKRDTLIKEMGKAAAKVWIRDSANIKYLNRIRRILVAAHRS